MRQRDPIEFQRRTLRVLLAGYGLLCRGLLGGDSSPGAGLVVSYGSGKDVLT
jgi:hypothetical protein